MATVGRITPRPGRGRDGCGTHLTFSLLFGPGAPLFVMELPVFMTGLSSVISSVQAILKGVQESQILGGIRACESDSTNHSWHGVRAMTPVVRMLRQDCKFRMAWATQKEKGKAGHPPATVIREACLVRVRGLHKAAQRAGRPEDIRYLRGIPCVPGARGRSCGPVS